jgi:hypothetical protein
MPNPVLTRPGRHDLGWITCSPTTPESLGHLAIFGIPARPPHVQAKTPIRPIPRSLAELSARPSPNPVATFGVGASGVMHFQRVQYWPGNQTHADLQLCVLPTRGEGIDRDILRGATASASARYVAVHLGRVPF